MNYIAVLTICLLINEQRGSHEQYVFKDILIVDVQKYTARFVSFERGLNVITSTESHVGKNIPLNVYH